MKKLILLAAAGLMTFTAFAQPKEEKDGFQFTTVKANPITSVKNQASSGTCWCFSGISLAESEAIRLGTATPETIDLSEMFVVGNTYIDRAVKYVRTDGHVSYGQGSSCKDVFYSMKDHGIVPNSEMPGLNYPRLERRAQRHRRGIPRQIPREIQRQRQGVHPEGILRFTEAQPRRLYRLHLLDPRSLL